MSRRLSASRIFGKPTSPIVNMINAMLLARNMRGSVWRRSLVIDWAVTSARTIAEPILSSGVAKVLPQEQSAPSSNCCEPVSIIDMAVEIPTSGLRRKVDLVITT